MAFFQGEIYSEQLEMCTRINVIIPHGVVNAQTPVIYLLHGLSDNCSNWLRLTSVERYANRHGAAVVIPEVQRSFYSDMKFGLKYFSYISSELIQIVGNTFNLPTSRDKTYIAGLSMGGFGALKCAFTKPEQYNSVAAFSAVCDIQDTIVQNMPAAKPDELYAIMGSREKVDDCNDLVALSGQCAQGSNMPAIFMTCGTKDMLYNQNLILKDHLNKSGFDLTFTEWEEDHTWEFWDRSIELALEFFFEKSKSINKTPLFKG